MISRILRSFLSANSAKYFGSQRNAAPAAEELDKDSKLKQEFRILITLLRILYLGQIGSTKLVLPKWHKYSTLNRVIRVIQRSNEKVDQKSGLD